MKILETIFLILTFAVPLFFALLLLTNLKRTKTNKRFKNRLITFMLLSLIINGAIFGVIKAINSRSEKDDANKSEIQKNEDTSIEEDIEDKDDNKTPTEIEDQQTNTSDANTSKTSKGFTIEVKDGITYVDGYLIVNKTYPLPSDYVPIDTYKAITTSNCQECLNNDAYAAYSKMKSDASTNGLSLWIASGYRSYSYQNGLYQSYVNRNGQSAADTYSARPGHSEHQSGLAFDLNTVSDSFANTKEGIWVNENCYKYGFIIRYPKDKDDETGYKYEPWHLRYVGIDLAAKLYNGGDWITMEDYFGITSAYQE